MVPANAFCESRMLNENTGRGIVLTVVAMMFIAGMDATGKLLTQNYPIFQILAIRFVIFFSVAVFVAARSGHVWQLRSKLFGTQVFRSLLLVVEISVFIYAFSLMPLADAHAIAAVAPLIATLMAGMFLGEVIGLRRWVSVAIGFVGALIIIRPGLGVWNVYALIPLLGAVLWAAYQVLLRRVSSADSPETTVLFTAVIGLIVFGALAPLHWITPSGPDWALLILNGALGSLGHYILIRALVLAPASTLQPFSYALLLWAIVFGLVVFGDLPDTFTFIGAAVVVAAGILSSDSGANLMRKFWR